MALTDIVFVADNDDDPAKRFQSVCEQIQSLFDKSAVPSAPFVKSRHKAVAGRPSIWVVMLPAANVHGHLETLCQPAAREADRGMANHVDTFLNLARFERWTSASRQGKAWLYANLAVRCEQDPDVPLYRVFDESRFDDLIPTGHSCFQPLADFLRGI